MDEGIVRAGLKPDQGEIAQGRRRRLRFSYKLALFAVDVTFLLASVWVGAWVIGAAESYTALDFVHRAILLSLCLLPLVFFPNFQLYSYHLIFRPKYHLAKMLKAFGMGLFVVGSVLLHQGLPEATILESFVPAVIGVSLAILLINRLLVTRFLEEKIQFLLKAIGLVFIAVGLIGILAAEGQNVLTEHRDSVLAGLLIGCCSVCAVRFVLVHLVFNIGLRRHFRRQVLLIGNNRDAERITNLIIRQNAPFWIAGTVSPQPGGRLLSAVPKTNLGRIQDLQAILGEHFFQEVIITDESISKPELINLLEFFTSRGINIWFTPKLMPIIELKLYIDSLCGIPLIQLESRNHQWVFSKAKYAVDAMAALVGSIFISPLLAAIALAIKMTSEGPVLYRAQAVGKGGRLFSLYKFRSMLTNSSKDIHKDYVTRLISGEITPDGSGTTLKITNDPRVTAVGRILRKTSLDELPQLINVLKGEMSLVGPRPCLPYEFEVYKDWHKRRVSVRPGITGLWQVVGRSEVSFEDMVLLDLYYIYNRSFDLDFNILFETFFAVLRKKGAC